MNEVFLFNKESMTLDQQPTMEKPGPVDASMNPGHIPQYLQDCHDYEDHLASLRRIPTLVEWEEGKELVEDKDFELFECDLCDGTGWYEGGETLQTGCTKCNGNGVIAVPTKAPVPADTDEVDNIAGTFIFDHEKETETYIPNPNFGKPVPAEGGEEKVYSYMFRKRDARNWLFDQPESNNEIITTSDVMAMLHRYYEYTFNQYKHLIVPAHSREEDAVKEIECLVKSYQEKVDEYCQFEQNSLGIKNENAARMWRHKREGLITAIRDLKKIISSKQ